MNISDNIQLRTDVLPRQETGAQIATAEVLMANSIRTNPKGRNGISRKSAPLGRTGRTLFVAVPLILAVVFILTTIVQYLLMPRLPINGQVIVATSAAALVAIIGALGALADLGAFLKSIIDSSTSSAIPRSSADQNASPASDRRRSLIADNRDRKFDTAGYGNMQSSYMQRHRVVRVKIRGKVEDEVDIELDMRDDDQL